MVSDKYQVRTTGPVDNLTHQPVKGRKRAGGIRFGEMERDSLLAHGVSFCLQDRLMNCSDYTISNVCKHCGSILSPIVCTEGSNVPYLEKVDTKLLSHEIEVNRLNPVFDGTHTTCLLCKRGDGIRQIALPYVFRYLATELFAMNIRMSLTIK